MLRLFIGLDVPMLAPLVRLIDQLSRMGSSVRPVRPDAMHITLRFLGNVSPDHVDALASVMDSVIAQGRDAGWLGPFDLTLAGIGTFPAQRDWQHGAPLRVIFAQPNDPGPLPRLSDLMDERIDALSLPIEKRDQPMHPHVTLARVKRRRSPDRRLADAVAKLINESHNTGLGSIRIKSIKLIESRPGAKGYDYVTRHVARL